MTHFVLHLALPVDRSSHRLHACNNIALFFSFSYFELFSFIFFSFCFLNFFYFLFFSFFYRFFNRKLYIFSTIAITTNATKYFFYLFFLCLFLFFLCSVSYFFPSFLFPFLSAILDIYLFILRYTIHI